MAFFAMSVRQTACNFSHGMRRAIARAGNSPGTFNFQNLSAGRHHELSRAQVLILKVRQW
jgi:hypothetical protein